MTERIPSAIDHRGTELNDENIIIMIGKELGYVVEHGYSVGQYILKRRPVLNGEPNFAGGTTMYLSCRIIGDEEIRFNGKEDLIVSLSDPDAISGLRDKLDAIMLVSRKSFEEPIYRGRGDRRFIDSCV